MADCALYSPDPDRVPTGLGGRYPFFPILRSSPGFSCGSSTERQMPTSEYRQEQFPAIKIPMQPANLSPFKSNAAFRTSSFTSNPAMPRARQVVKLIPKTSSSSFPINPSTFGGAFKLQDVLKPCNMINSVHRSFTTLQVRDKILAPGCG
ncbi:hypothetical protein DFH06DRAFT_1246798 [Mycena polygramma]|nr:hypothetical protein DFH06DRAFT_1246798 [Mycena polygramma]